VVKRLVSEIITAIRPAGRSENKKNPANLFKVDIAATNATV